MPIKEAQQTVKQHAVPQNIMQVEFKVIGELTMRQFFYLIMAAIFAFGIFKSGLPYIVRLPLAIAMAASGVAVAFLPIQDRGLDQWISNFFSAIYAPTQRIWRKEAETPSYFLYQSAHTLRTEMLAVAPTASRRKLEQYLEYETKDHEKDEVDKKEEEYINKVKVAFEKEEQLRQAQALAAQPQIRDVTPPSRPAVQPQVATPKPSIQVPKQEPETRPQIAPPQALQQLPPIEKRPETPMEQPKPQTFKHTPMPEVTPDRLTGRRFTSVSSTEGEIILPIRGERVIKTAKESIEEDINQKANELMEIIEKVKKEHKDVLPPPEPAKEKELPVNKVSESALDKLKQDNDKLALEIENLRKSLQESTKTQEEKDNIQNQITRLTQDKMLADNEINALKHKIEELEEQLKKGKVEAPKIDIEQLEKKAKEESKVEPKVELKIEIKEEPKPTPANIPLVKPQVIPPSQQASFSNAPSITNIPNIINGIVKDQYGKLVSSAVVIIKDQREDTVRALKTNNLGQFAITTPVTNGTYYMEISKEGMNFDKVSIQVKGEVLPPIEFVGKL